MVKYQMIGHMESRFTMSENENTVERIVAAVKNGDYSELDNLIKLCVFFFFYTLPDIFIPLYTPAHCFGFALRHKQQTSFNGRLRFP